MLSGSGDPSGSAGNATRVTALVPIIAMVVSATVSLAPPARADLASDLRDAVAQARGGSSCGALHADPVADRVAATVNKSYSDWLDHTSTYPPITDPLPGLKELGYHGTKGKLLGGASKKNRADAIKGVVLEGYAAIADCSFTDYGVNMWRNEASGYSLAAVVLAGR